MQTILLGLEPGQAQHHWLFYQGKCVPGPAQSQENTHSYGSLEVTEGIAYHRVVLSESQPWEGPELQFYTKRSSASP